MLASLLAWIGVLEYIMGWASLLSFSRCCYFIGFFIFLVFERASWLACFISGIFGVYWVDRDLLFGTDTYDFWIHT